MKLKKQILCDKQFSFLYLNNIKYYDILFFQYIIYKVYVQ